MMTYTSGYDVLLVDQCAIRSNSCQAGGYRYGDTEAVPCQVQAVKSENVEITEGLLILRPTKTKLES